MWLVFSLTLVACSLSLSSSQSLFQNFGQSLDQGRGRAAQPQQEQPRSSQRGSIPQSSARGSVPLPQGSNGREEQRETTTPVPQVAILKQINEHNEDGSYTYGYEAADGTFKLETRFTDGSVQGKYGYVDVNGEVKIIEYGANAMGFQPQGDLPEGIIIPPPVAGNCTDCNYDYDYDYVEEVRSGVVIEDSNNLVVQNRARGNSNQPQQQSLTSQSQFPSQNQFSSQNRGQQLNQPITQAPLPRRGSQPAQQPQQQQRPQQQTFQSFAARQPAQQPQQQQQRPIPVRQSASSVRQPPQVPVRQQITQSRQQPTQARQQSSAAVPSRQSTTAAIPSRNPVGAARPVVQSRQPASAAVPSRLPVGAAIPAVPSRQAAPQRSEFRPTRPTPPPTIAPVRRLPDPIPSSSSGSRGGSSAFSNFPARDNSPNSRARPSGAQTSQRFQAVAATPEPAQPSEPERQTVGQADQQPINTLRGRQRTPTRNNNATPSRNINATPSRSQPQLQQQQPQRQPQLQPQRQPQQQPLRQPQQQPLRQPQQQPQQQSVFQAGPLRPAFEGFSSGGASQSFNSFPAVSASRQAAPAPRPALTFQEPQPVSAVPSNLPKSALEIVDFNQLVQEFQGSLRPQQPANRFQNNVFSNPPNTQTRFSTDNFPVRF